MEENFSMEWYMEGNFSMEWKIFGMEWKKIASLEYGKIVFHSIPCPGNHTSYEIWHSQTAKNILLKYRKKTKNLYAKKKNNKELSSFEDRKVNTNFCYSERKSFVTLQVQCHCYGRPGGLTLNQCSL